MKGKTIPYKNFSSFILRSPLFSFDFIESLTSGKNISEEQLLEVCKNPVVDEALFLASPDLHAQLHARLEGKLTDNKKVRRLHYGLMRYVLRMSTRPTPFGLFAGFNVGNWDEETRVELPPQEKYSRHTRLDMNYLCALAQELGKHPVIKEKIKWYPNSSVYPVGNQLRYVEYRYREGARRTHHIVAVDHSEYLQNVLDVAGKGAYLKDLAGLLVDEEISAEEAREFIEELVSSQLLVNELEPAITGPEFLNQILAVLEGVEGIDDVRENIVHIKNLLQEVDQSKIGTTVSYYHRIAEDLKPLNTTFELKFLFQTDMVKPVGHCVVDESVAQDLLEGMDALNRLSRRPSATTLTQFRDAFFERWETKEIPLLQALDTEAGIGYRQTRDAGDVAPLVDDLAVPGSGESSQEINWNPVTSFLLKKYRESLANNSYEVEITEKELEPFEPVWNDLPDSLSTMVKIVENKSDKYPKPRVLMGGFGGSGAGNLLGRFCHADETTDTFVKEITKKEGELNPDVIMAEIIHLPESRVGNVLLRPVLRPYEIPYLAKAAVPEEFHIKVDDLMVSVKANQVVLRSKRLNKRIIPRLTNAHNYSYNALPVYHFLADMQTQNLRGGIGFNWGPLANEYDFLPRVIYKNLIFNPATWNIRRDDLKDIVKIKEDDPLYGAIQEWRTKLRMPAYVWLADSDNKLFINLENLMCIRTLFSVTKNRGGFQLEEFLFDPGNSIVKGEEGVFTNEFIFSFYNAGKLDADSQQAQQQQEDQANNK
ncbi:MAG: hypothetical protein GTO45_00960 [Candidatus Aminicenantes bacterium]|nr:hypothetical protein [Candidatus Aminicenantes bacterium]NIM77333.1 hypothetical protein [Candidatus Aminicenantes bacterium]NIN16634.1 hypothetical protein [Candidatus Aminicenantes bacterium]NIN40492.1 hypothetical protein [Candidatus Aminicenantes bacterium]NIN83312.1 hypothetical protein [Candidatus Aminicenantes bacterium]